MAAHHHIFQRRHVGKQADVLEGAGNACARHFMHGAGLVGHPGQLEGAGIGLIQARDHIEEGGLARTVSLATNR